MLQTQSAVRTTAHGGVDRGRSQGVDVADNICGTADGDRDDVRGFQGADRELMGLSDTAGSGDQGDGVATNAQGVTGASKD